MTTTAASLSLRTLDLPATERAASVSHGDPAAHDHGAGQGHGHAHEDGHDHGHDHHHGPSADPHGTDPHRHGHGETAAQGSGHRHTAGLEPLHFSLVRASVTARLALAGGLSALIWAAVLWARLPIVS